MMSLSFATTKSSRSILISVLDTLRTALGGDLYIKRLELAIVAPRAGTASRQIFELSSFRVGLLCRIGTPQKPDFLYRR